MPEVFDFLQGGTPLLISVPHDGRRLPDGLRDGMTEAGLAIRDTDWYVRRLYEFAGAGGASVLSANYSRYVVDLNRSSDDTALYADQVSTGLCPLETFAGQPLYRDGFAPDSSAIAQRVAQFWEPYHEKLRVSLEEIRKRHGYALLWDAHSIRAEVPALFAGELPDLNLGTNGGVSCSPILEENLERVAADSPYSWVLNGRFLGGYITRHYGAPADGVHAVQLELAQRCYMDENTLRYDDERAAMLITVIQELLRSLQDRAATAQTDREME